LNELPSADLITLESLGLMVRCGVRVGLVPNLLAAPSSQEMISNSKKKKIIIIQINFPEN
jgi:hypothetical protein